jgi:hypothetical protein
MEPIVIDDFIPEIYQDSIYHLLSGSEFNWTFGDYSVSAKSLEDLYQIDEPYQEHIQMRHRFVTDNEIMSPNFQYITPLLGEYVKATGKNIKGMYRIKANLLISQPGPQNQYPHADGMEVENGVLASIGKKTLLYYVNDADGDTAFYNERFDGSKIGQIKKVLSVTPKKGRAVIFDSNQLHAASCPKDSRYRMVINCVFFE